MAKKRKRPTSIDAAPALTPVHLVEHKGANRAQRRRLRRSSGVRLPVTNVPYRRTEPEPPGGPRGAQGEPATATATTPAGETRAAGPRRGRRS